MAVGLSALRAGRALLSRNIFWYSFLLEAIRAIVRLEGSVKLKKFNAVIGNQTSELPPCSPSANYEFFEFNFKDSLVVVELRPL
jgi:hypothetical protein